VEAGLKINTGRSVRIAAAVLRRINGGQTCASEKKARVGARKRGLLQRGNVRSNRRRGGCWQDVVSCNGPTFFNLSGVSRDHKEGLSSSLRALELSLFPVSGVCGVLFGHHRPLSTICWQYNISSRVCPVVDAKLPTCKNSLL
jgi:hypothetical protein